MLRIDGDSCVAEEMRVMCVCVREERRGEKHKIDKRQCQVLKKKKKEMYINK